MEKPVKVYKVQALQDMQSLREVNTMSELTLRDSGYEGYAGKWRIDGIEILVVAPDREELMQIMAKFQPAMTCDPNKFTLVKVQATWTPPVKANAK